MSAARTARCLAGRSLGRRFGFLTGSFHRRLAGLFGVGAKFALVANFFQFVVGEMFDADKGILCRADSNEFSSLTWTAALSRFWEF
jgi:hypothetical protein